MNQIFYEIFKFLMGFLLALVILAGGSVAAALYFVTKLTALPPKPTFPNDAPAKVASASKAKLPANQPQAASTQPSASPTSTPTPLPPGAYRARVSWPEGLVLRDKPTYESSTIGGIAYNENVLILEVTSSKEWERVRVESTKEEGWVRGGNTERIGN